MNEITSEKLTLYMALIFIIVIFARLISYMIKAKWGKEANELETVKSNQAIILKILEKQASSLEGLYNCHLGPQALGRDSVPRWYNRDEIEEKLDSLIELTRTMQARVAKIEEIMENLNEHF